MSYHTSCRGQISITPPLTWGQIRESDFLPHDLGGAAQLDIALVVEQANEERDQGTLTVRLGVGVEQRYEDDARNYNIVRDLQQLIDAFPDHEFAGRFDCEGEETGDLWRLEVQGRKAVKVLPRIVWPDGSETSPR